MRTPSYFSNIHITSLHSFSSLRLQGSFFSLEFFQQLLEARIEGREAKTYHFDSEAALEHEIQQSWNRLQKRWNTHDPKMWASTLNALEAQWLFPLFAELGYQEWFPEPQAFGNTYYWDQNPILFLPYSREISSFDRVAFCPQEWMQEKINRSELPLWGFISNGRVLRLLHSSVSLTRETYLEFDLVSIMTHQHFSDFCLLWLLCHSTRLDHDLKQQNYLESWFRLSQTQHILPQLKQQFRKVLVTLGRGFLAHPENQALRDKIKTPTFDLTAFYQQLLQVFYRFLFLLITEKRDQLLDPKAPSQTKQKYWEFYSLRSLQKLTQQPTSATVSLWQNMLLIFDSLSSEKGFADLAIPPLGGTFWSSKLTPDLHLALLSNEDLLTAIHTLSFWEKAPESQIDYTFMGIEVLGNLYESFLELRPHLNPSGVFDLEVGEEVIYYPPTVMNHLLNTVFDPVLESALAKKNAEETLLQFKVCDPACGSGYFLIAVAHRLARRMASYHTTSVSSQKLQSFLRKVISRCLYGVDINPLAVHLCQFNLLLESFDCGKPLLFFNHHIQCGNSLVGATPALLKRGIPDEAFHPQFGDNARLCKEYQNKNQQERSEILSYLSSPPPTEYLSNLSLYFEEIENLPENTFEDIREKQQRFEDITRSHSYLYRRIWADAWCAVFVWKKHEQAPPTITEGLFHQLETDPYSLTLEMMNEIRRLAIQYKFFHWHLAFPHIFKIPNEATPSFNEQTGWSGGFDVVLSAPPCEYTENMRHFIHSSHRYPCVQKKEFLPVEIFVENSQLLSTNQGRIGFLLTPQDEDRLSQIPPKLTPESIADLLAPEEKNKPQVFLRIFSEKPPQNP